MDVSRVDSLRSERDRYVSLAFCWADLLFEIDRNLDIVFAAGATRPFFGKTAESLTGTSFRDLVAPADIPMVCQALKRIMRAGRVHEELLRVAGVEGNLIAVSMSAYCLDETEGNLYVGLRKMPARGAVATVLPRDAATGLFDSSNFADIAADRLKKIQAAGEEANVTLLSIQGLDELQRRIDPAASKALQRSVSDFLRANSVAGDTAAKVGEGQYSLLHGANTRIDELVAQIEALSKKADPKGQGVAVETATMDMAELGEFSEEDLAKGLLYTMNKFRDAEGAGVSLVDLTSNMSTLVGEAVAEVNNFRQVVSQAEFYVALQPIIHINTGDIHHFEALVRFDSKPGESPFRTITFAEETGLIHEFDFAMVKKVVEWLSKFPRNNTRVKAAVNVSGFSIGKPSYVDGLMKILRENDHLQGKLMFEITESSRMTDLDGANNFIQNLRKRGYHVCLDDFGAGAASFQYLSVLEVDVVKLDGSTVKNAQKAPKGRAFLSALTELCRRMGVETIAEMVDTPDTLDFCRDVGANYVQGYLFGKPSRDIRDFTPLPQANLFKPLTAMRHDSLRRI